MYQYPIPNTSTMTSRNHVWMQFNFRAELCWWQTILNSHCFCALRKIIFLAPELRKIWNIWFQYWFQLTVQPWRVADLLNLSIMNISFGHKLVILCKVSFGLCNLQYTKVVNLKCAFCGHLIWPIWKTYLTWNLSHGDGTWYNRDMMGKVQKYIYKERWDFLGIWSYTVCADPLCMIYNCLITSGSDSDFQ